MIDKPLQISDMSLSEKDILQDKDNSIVNKSFYSTDFNFPDLVTKKNYLQVKLIPLEYHMQIHSKSIKKIFNLISNNDQTELEDNYLDYITCLIGEGEELDKQNLLAENGQQIMQNILDPSYYELLNKTKVFYIDIPKSTDNMNMNININNIINKKINLRKQSLEKIASFLGLNIFDMSDYIEIFILTYKEKDDDILLGERFLLRAKLMGKLSNSIEDIKLDNEFNGIKKFDIDLKDGHASHQRCRFPLHTELMRTFVHIQISAHAVTCAMQIVQALAPHRLSGQNIYLGTTGSTGELT